MAKYVALWNINRGPEKGVIKIGEELPKDMAAEEIKRLLASKAIHDPEATKKALEKKQKEIAEQLAKEGQ